MPNVAKVKAAKGKVETKPTEYVVLEQIKAEAIPADGPATDLGQVLAWREVDRVTAHGQEATILDKWAAEKGKGGIFKLCPARSWKGGRRYFEQTKMIGEAIS